MLVDVAEIMVLFIFFYLQVFVLTVLFGLFHGLVFLTTVLSLIGPTSGHQPTSSMTKDTPVAIAPPLTETQPPDQVRS